ncbi:MAG TPA: capsule assembly Wzi family protein, partial [Bacteroidales bacterium]|nr:capsule assembly Wzi family protein [Bacteroidales bacterium]
IFGIGFIGLQAQTVPVGTPFFEDALRRAQLTEKVNPDVSFMIRPVDATRALGIDNPFGEDTLLFPLDSNSYTRLFDQRGHLSFKGKPLIKPYNKEGKNNLRLTLLPVYAHTRFNGHHPYGWSDGAMVPNRGLQQYLSAGIYGRIGILEAQLRPELVWGQNKEFQNPPFRPIRIDMPERMGQSNYEKIFLGQSFVKLHLGPIAVGLSNENIWWGPGRKNAIVMSNNAPGFGHFTLHTNRPIKTRIGTFEGQMAIGKLHRSGFTYPSRYTPGEWPPIAGNVVPDTIGDVVYGFFNGMVGVYQPKWTPGLFLGISRVVQLDREAENLWDYFKILTTLPKKELNDAGVEAGNNNRNQIISVFARYLFRKSHAEVYMEIGREDNWFDFEDLMTRPQYSTAYMFGFRKLYALKKKDSWLEVSGEYTKIQAPVENYNNPNFTQNSFYTHANGIGWTHRGQVLGAGIGPGSNMMTFGAQYFHGFNTFGLQFERVIYNEDLFYRIDYLNLGFGNPFFVDGSKHFVDWGFIFNHHTSFGKLFVGYQLHLMRTYNFQWNYDPYGGQGLFRYNGINVWSLNAELTLMYRF